MLTLATATALGLVLAAVAERLRIVRSDRLRLARRLAVYAGPR